MLINVINCNHIGIFLKMAVKPTRAGLQINMS
jgi:hypothetical protein